MSSGLFNQDIAASNYNLYSTHLEHGETSPIGKYFGQMYLIDQYGEAHHDQEWSKIYRSEIDRANVYVKEIKANGGSVQKGDTFGKWLVYGSFGWSWTDPITQGN